jgi:hypothetical protein
VSRIAKPNKPITSLSTGLSRHYMRQISKSALVDVVVALVRSQHPGESFDDAALWRALCATCDPVLIMRGDKIPSRSR